VNPPAVVAATPTSLQQFRQLTPADLDVTDVVLASNVTSGSAGVVRLGDLRGRPVAVKTIFRFNDTDPAARDQKALEEARGAWTFSSLGVGPRMHGVSWDATDQRWAIVTDIAQGDFPSAMQGSINANTLQELEHVLYRFHEAGIRKVGDFQYFVTKEGRITVIDPEGAYGYIGKPTNEDPNGVDGSFTTNREELIAQAPGGEAVRYLEWLHKAGGMYLYIWRTLCQKMSKSVVLRRYPTELTKYLTRTCNEWR
jgi:hypothetical protein